MPPSERLGDRRAEVRFEIIGDLWSTLVTTQSLPLLDLGFGGVLVECGDPLIVGSQHQVRLSLGDNAYDVIATVKHVTPGRDQPARYLVGFAFVSLSAETREWIAIFLGVTAPLALERRRGVLAESFVERRQTPRVRVSGRGRLDRPIVMSVRLLDIGWRGLLLLSSQPLEVGRYAHLSARLGDVPIDGDIEVRRVNTQRNGNGYRVGARFVSLEPTTQQTIQQFLAAATR